MAEKAYLLAVISENVSIALIVAGFGVLGTMISVLGAIIIAKLNSGQKNIDGRMDELLESKGKEQRAVGVHEGEKSQRDRTEKRRVTEQDGK